MNKFSIKFLHRLPQKDLARKCDLNRNIIFIFITNGELIRALPTHLGHLES